MIIKKKKVKANLRKKRKNWVGNDKIIPWGLWEKKVPLWNFFETFSNYFLERKNRSKLKCQTWSKG